MKGLILAAGKGKRLFPLTIYKPKPLIEVAGKPTIMYSIEKLLANGITDIGIVINERHEKLFRDTININEGNISYIYQNDPRGLADAVYKAKDFINGDNFILMLGDNIIEDDISGLINSSTQNSIMLKEVDNPSSFGVAELYNKRVVNVEEKPDNPKSNLIILGVYKFNSKIYSSIENIAPQEISGELEITDAIKFLINQGTQVGYSITNNSFFDIGTKDRLEVARDAMRDKM